MRISDWSSDVCSSDLDLPLMPGLKELPHGGLVFDKPGGRIVEAFARGAIAPQSVIAFYDDTLPQLGWQREAAGAYLREGERLELHLGEDAEGTTVHFRLFPQSGKIGRAPCRERVWQYVYISVGPDELKKKNT